MVGLGESTSRVGNSEQLMVNSLYLIIIIIVLLLLINYC